MHQLRAGLGRGDGEISGTDRIDLIVQIHMLLGSIDRCIGRTVNNDRGLHFPCQLQYGIHVGDIQFRYIGIYQMYILIADQQSVNRNAQLAVTACNNDIFHELSCRHG